LRLVAKAFLQEFKAQVIGIMLGGKVSIWELARNPEVYQKMRKEVASVSVQKYAKAPITQLLIDGTF
jgi:hypothetical protein